MPERKIEATIDSVTAREVTRQRDNAKFTIYDIATSGGTVTTSVRRIAEEAHAAIGQGMRLLTIDERQGNQKPDGGYYMNYYLQKVELPFGGGTIQPSGAFPVPQGQRGDGFPSVTPEPELPKAAPGGLSGYAKDVNIMAQVAVKSAVHISDNAQEFKINCDAMLYWLTHDYTWPDEMQAERQYVPAGADQGTGGEFSDDDIPF